MSRRLAILTEIIAPYRIPVFNALAERDDIAPHVIFLAETDPSLRQWQVYRDEIRFSYEVLKSHRRRMGKINVLISRGVSVALEASRVDVILSGGYSDLAMWQAQRWARRRRIPFLLWSESNAMDARKKFWWVEAAKRKFILGCQGYVVPGSCAAAYLESFGVAKDLIFLAPNAVDVERFASAAEQARQDAGLRQRLGLPERYLLYVGRFVVAKGVFDLLQAYAKLPEEIRRAVGLVLAGDGKEREELIRRSRLIHPGRVWFPGFVQRDQLAGLYALAEALVFPTHSDPWGLVVNEAMACGLPVISTDVAGSTADLVRDGVNGYVVGARQPEALSRAMEKVVGEPGLRKQMGQMSLQINSTFTPQRWAAGVAGAVVGGSGACRG